jgi:hypothetical protein
VGDQLKAERELAAARAEQYAQVIDIGPRWDAGAPIPHVISNGYSEAPFRQLHHYALLFHDEMLEALACGLESRLVEGTMRETLGSLTDSLIDQPYRAER